MRSRFFLSLAALAILGTGCALQKAYKGPTRPKAEIAVIKARGAIIRGIDGESGSLTSYGIAVLPGRHELEVSLDPGNFLAATSGNDKLKVAFTADAGKDYLVKGGAGLRGCVWVEDEQTAKQVSDSVCLKAVSD